jgi:hypothetical protein
LYPYLSLSFFAFLSDSILTSLSRSPSASRRFSFSLLLSLSLSFSLYLSAFLNILRIL